MKHHLDYFLGNDLGGWGVRGCLCSLSQPEQSHGSRSENGKQIAHGLNRLQTPIFEQTARFENFVEIFDKPSPLVPSDALPSILCGGDGHAGDQDPFQRFNAFRWLRLPDPYQRCLERPYSHALPDPDLWLPCGTTN